MKQLNQHATKVFNRVVERLNGSSHIKIENSTAFMPLSVERLGTHDIGTVYSFCHYFEQNGDMCQDPEMLFLAHPNGRVYPMMFQQAIPPVYQESIYYDDGWKVKERLQKDHTSFANMWMKNIKHQQDI